MKNTVPLQMDRRWETANAKPTVLGSTYHVRGVPERNDVVFAAAQRGPGTGSPQRADEAREHILFTEAFNGQNQPAESHSHHGPLCCRNKVSKHNTSLLSPERLGRVFPRGETGERVQKTATAREEPTVEKRGSGKIQLKGGARRSRLLSRVSTVGVNCPDPRGRQMTFR